MQSSRFRRASLNEYHLSRSLPWSRELVSASPLLTPPTARPPAVLLRGPTPLPRSVPTSRSDTCFCTPAWTRFLRMRSIWRSCSARWRAGDASRRNCVRRVRLSGSRLRGGRRSFACAPSGFRGHSWGWRPLLLVISRGREIEVTCDASSGRTWDGTRFTSMANSQSGRFGRWRAMAQVVSSSGSSRHDRSFAVTGGAFSFRNALPIVERSPARVLLCTTTTTIVHYVHSTILRHVL